MNEEEKKQKARERAKRYYLKHKEEILKKQAIYKKEKYSKMTPEEKKEFMNKRKRIMQRYRSKNKEKFKEYNKQYKERKIERGEIPKTKKMIIEELQKENYELKRQQEAFLSYLNDRVRKLRLKVYTNEIICCVEIANKYKEIIGWDDRNKIK